MHKWELKQKPQTTAHSQSGLQESEAKIKEGAFVGPEILMLVDEEFRRKLKPIESAASETFVLIN